MLLKAGVDISRLNPEIRRTLTKIDDLYHLDGEDMIITSTYGGNHIPSSLHYHNDAIDIRWPRTDTVNRANRAKTIARILGNNFDVVPELNHIHIEYDPKEGGKTE